MKSDPEKVVFDCPVFAQALINPKGPAAACITHAQQGRLILVISDYVLQEIRELPGKIKPKLGVTAEAVERFIQDLAKYAHPVQDVPLLYIHPIDPDDSHYVNLAVETNAKLIVTRDRHLLNLMDVAKPEGEDFRSRFPSFVVTTPDRLIQEMRESEAWEGE